MSHTSIVDEAGTGRGMVLGNGGDSVRGAGGTHAAEWAQQQRQNYGSQNLWQ